MVYAPKACVRNPVISIGVSFFKRGKGQGPLSFLPYLNQSIKEYASLLVFFFFKFIDADFIFTDLDGEPIWVFLSSQNED